METMSVGEFKSNFSGVLKRVLAGEEIGISFGKKKKLWQGWCLKAMLKNLKGR